jgi:hypothetical protein
MRGPSAPSRMTAEEERAFAFADDVLKLANGLVDAAIAALAIQRDRRNAQSYGIALLCRSISNFQGSLTMARDNQAVECLTLVLSCLENMLLVGCHGSALTANSAHLQPGRSGSGSPHWFAGMLV